MGRIASKGPVLGIVFLMIFVVLVNTPLSADDTNSEGLVSYWKFDEGYGDIAYDSIGDNDGTLKSPRSWKLMDLETKPSARAYSAMASISNSDKVILFGGQTSSGFNGETWIYDLSDNAWTQKYPSSSPSARLGHAMASIPGDDKVIIFGGSDSTSGTWSHLYDTWVYDFSDNQWANKNPTTYPPDRKYHAMTSIANDDKVLLFGGKVGPSSKYDDTWIYDLSENTWTKKNPSSHPPKMYYPMLAGLYNTDQAVLFGGYLGFHVYDDKTWVYDYSDNTWTNQNPTNHPSARGLGPMATVFNDDKVVIFGGYIEGVGRSDETWEYDLSDNSWVKITSIHKPSARYLPQLVGISNNDKLVMFGGHDGDFDGETWIFRRQGPNWVDGVSGKALEFDGVNDYVSVPDDDTLDISDSYTVSAWFKCSGAKVVGGQAIVAHGESFDTDKMQYSLFLQPNGKDLWAWYEDSGDSEHELNAPDTLVYNRWYHAAVVLTSDSQYRLFLNGVEKDSSTESAKPPSISNILTIGCLTNSGSHPRYEGFFNGIIDEVMVWNKALSEDEIRQQYLEGLGVIVDIDPNTLNLKSNGKWITCYIEMAKWCDVNDMDISTIKLNNVIQAESTPTEISDYDYDEIPDLMVKFDWANAIQILEPGKDVEIIITGKLNDYSFEGNDFIRVIKEE
jgi:N-acetylneuraminic acid mutarotase